MVSFFEQHSYINSIWLSSQHSTLHPILDILTDCLDNIHSKNFFTSIFLDIKKAFDSVCHKKFTKGLEFYGIHGLANELLQSYLKNRLQYVTTLGMLILTLKNRIYGVSQESILRLLLFLIFINDLPACLHSVPRLFLDDTTLLIGETTFL